MLKRASLTRNVISNVGGYVVSILVAFVMSPIIIQSLGDSRYGIWALVGQIVGYYSLLDLGLQGAITHYIARCLAQNDRAQLRSHLASGFWALAALGAVAFLLGAAIATVFPIVFDIEDTSVAEARNALLVMSVFIAINFPMTAFNGTLVAHERLDLLNGIEVFTRVLGAFAIYFVLQAGGGLVELALIQGGVSMIRWILVIVSVRRLLGTLSLSPSLAQRANLRELSGYGGQSLIVNLALLVIYRTDLIVIGIFMGTSWVTIYAIGQMLVQYMSTAGSVVARSFTPRLTHLAAQDDHAELERTYLLGARTTATLVAPMAGCMLAFGHSFLRLWLGDKYVSGNLGERADVIMYILVAANLPRVLQSISWQLVFATRQHAFLARLNSMEAVANLGLSLCLVQYLGLIGVAVGTLIPLLVTHVFFLPRYIANSFGIPIRHYIATGIFRPSLVGLACYLVGGGLTRVIPPSNWSLFFGEAAFTTAIGATLLYIYVLDYDGKRHVHRILARLLPGATSH